MCSVDGECYDVLLCLCFLKRVLVQVPLDYSHPDGPKAGIALLKVPSKLPPGHDDYKGPILFNPGKSKVI